jgi:hypothetical protein
MKEVLKLKMYEKPSIIIESLISNSAIAINAYGDTSSGEVSVSTKGWFDDDNLLGEDD